jgi:N-acetylglucosaminyl-diphospho-decaprenol L-rhamnosyltransferase
VHDVCAIIVSHNSKAWLEPALSSLYARAGGIDLDVVVVDNGDDGAAAEVEQRFPAARTITCPNRGFAHANNCALETAEARYVLFLNPDTEFLGGSLAELIAALERRPEVGLAGVRQVGSDGALAPSMRRFPSTPNMLAEAFGVERVPGLRRVLGERHLDPRLYARETLCDWTSGSFMLARREALAAAGGGFDERFFLFSEETDLCWRIKNCGWEVIHLPCVTIRHHEHGASARLEAQVAYARLQFARKHLRPLAPYRAALGLRYALRAIGGRRDREGREAARAALGTVLSERAPFAAALEATQATIVSAPGSERSSTLVRSPM